MPTRRRACTGDILIDSRLTLPRSRHIDPAADRARGPADADSIVVRTLINSAFFVLSTLTFFAPFYLIHLVWRKLAFPGQDPDAPGSPPQRHRLSL